MAVDESQWEMLGEQAVTEDYFGKRQTLLDSGLQL